MLGYFVAGVFILFSFLYAGAETGVYCINSIRLRYKASRGIWAAKTIYRLLEDSQSLVCTILVGNNIVNYMATVFFIIALENTFSPRKAELFATLILTPFILVFGELLPKTIFQERANTMLLRLAPLLNASSYTLKPIVSLLTKANRIPNFFLKDAGGTRNPFFSLQRLGYFLSEGAKEGVVTPYQNLMAKNIMKLGRVPLRNVMIPLKDVTLIPATINGAGLTDIARSRKFSRLPVYEDHENNVIGIINLFDFLSANGSRPEIKGFIRGAAYFDCNMPIDDVLLKLQQSKQNMGIVIDQHKKAVGIVTIKDLVEEIVGELAVW
jgi:CBS domain containing-hemolysin-like protein